MSIARTLKRWLCPRSTIRVVPVTLAAVLVAGNHGPPSTDVSSS
jgi:hypothetical protein